MNASKAKRRWNTWQRYVTKTGTRATSNRHGGYTHRGMVFAYSDTMFAGRRGHRGPRNVWLFRSTWETIYRG